jgi:uncharacterized membrane protein
VDDLIVVAILFIIFVLLGPIMAFVALGRANRVQRELDLLKATLAQKGRAEPHSLAPPPTTKSVAAASPPPQTAPRAAALTATPTPTKKQPTRADLTRAALKKRNEKQANSAKTAKAKAPKRSFEERMGAQWTVWLGGIILAFGALFLLRYTIEAGVFTPAMRIGLAGILGIVFLGIGEFLRRKSPAKAKEPASLIDIRQNAYIPGVLTAVGIFTLFGTVYAAYTLYDFITVAPTFVLLGLLSVGALALSLLHGPRLAALGLLASLVTPLLVQTGEPRYVVLFMYLTFVTLAALVVAHRRNWDWLNLMSMIGLIIWGALALDAHETAPALISWSLYMLGGFIASTYIALRTERLNPINITPAHNAVKKVKGQQKPILQTKRYDAKAAILWAAGAALLFLFATLDTSKQSFAFVYIPLAFGGILMASGWRFGSQKLNIISGALLSAFSILSFSYAHSSVQAIAYAVVLIGIVLFLSVRILKTYTGKNTHIIWSVFSAILPIFVLIGLVDNIPVRENFSEDLIKTAFFILTAAFAGLAWYLWKKDGKTRFHIPVNAYVFGAALSYLLACIYTFHDWSFAFSMMFGIILAALASTKIPTVSTRMVSAGFALLTAYYVLEDLVPADNFVSTRPIFNELWLAFALPAVLCAASAWLMVRNKRDLWSEGMKALTLTFGAIFAIFQIHHFMNNGDVLADHLSLNELALQVLVGLSFTLGGSLINRKPINLKTKNVYENLIPFLAVGVSLLTLFAFVIGIVLRKNPLLNDNILIDGTHFISFYIFNSLLLAFLLPAILLAGIAYLSRNNRPKAYVTLVGGLSLMSLLLYVTAMVRYIFVGPVISLFTKPPHDLELYIISASWLVLGIILLVVGMRKHSQSLRLASAIVIIMTVLKAFFIDMASLEGVLRAMSFVVLGGVLIVIGQVYQKILFNKTP